MDPRSLVDSWGLPLATFLVGLVSGFVPFVNAEAYLLGVAVLAPGADSVPVVLLATLGQMLSKSALFFSARGSRRLSRTPVRWLEVACERLQARRGQAWLVMLLSAFSGLPPFYVMSVAAGALNWPFAAFAVAGGCGRLARFALLFALPQLFLSKGGLPWR
jgi:membrane protein YqaA with SNARE-associated domain